LLASVGSDYNIDELALSLLSFPPSDPGVTNIMMRKELMAFQLLGLFCIANT
jgi:hypothetical protein